MNVLNTYSNELDINNDTDLTTFMDTVISLVKKIDEYINRVSTLEDNYYNHQDVMNYQDILNEYSINFNN